jgi:diacylglycerol kinase (ATP)
VLKAGEKPSERKDANGDKPGRDSGWIDLGRVRAGGRCASFVNVAGCGFDAEVVRRTPSGGGRGGPLPYLAGVLRTLLAFRPRPMRFVLDGGPALERRALGVAVAIGPRYGGGLTIAPQAVLDDGLLDVCLVGDLGPGQLLALLPRLYAGTHAGHPAVEFFRCRELRAECAQRGVACQADGELLGELPHRRQPVADLERFGCAQRRDLLGHLPGDGR